jgi:hypothetical protein
VAPEHPDNYMIRTRTQLNVGPQQDFTSQRALTVM